MADKLSIYKGALRLLGPHELATLSDDRPERYQLDDAWSDALAYVLADGLWNFAIRVVSITAEASPSPAPVGWDFVHLKPDDYVRTVGISSEATFQSGFEDFEDEGDRWVANCDPLYVRYTSNSASYGADISRWPPSATKALEAYLAFECGLPISGDRGNRNDLFGLYEKRLARAKAIDAFNEPVKFPPAGRIVRARFTRRNSRDD